MRNNPVILLILFSAMFVYLILRAVYVPFTHDEAATFFHFVHTGRFLPFLSDWSTNNHVLNSLLTYAGYHLLGPSQFAQRLPNLLFIPVFFWFLWRLSVLLRSRILQWSFILIILSTHHFMDFFSLSRGYGMGMALLAGGIFYIHRALTYEKTKDYAFAMLFLFFSVSALLLLVNTYILVILLLLANSVVKEWSDLRRAIHKILVLAVTGIIPAVLTIVYLLGLKDAGRIDYGGMEGFWPVTVKGLTELFFAGYSDAANIGVLFFSILLTVLILLSLKKIFPPRADEPLLRPGHLFFYLLAGNILASHAENILFDVLYPDARAAIYLVILFAGSLLFLLDEVDLKPVWKYSLLAPFALLPIHFAGAVNLRFSESDTHNFNIPENFYHAIAASHRPGDFPPTIQGYQLRGMRWNFMNFVEKKELGMILYTGYPSMLGDFQIVVPTEYPGWKDHYTLRQRAGDSELALLERNEKLEKHLIIQNRIIGDGTDRSTYFSLLDMPADSLAGASLFIGFRISALSESKPFRAWLVAEVRDRDEKAVRYEYIPLDWFRTSWAMDDEPFINGFIVEDIPTGATTLKCYLWNLHEVPYSLGQCETSVFRILTEN